MSDAAPPGEGGPTADLALRRRQQRSWYFYDWANSAYVTTTATVLFTPYLASIARAAACPGGDTDPGVVDGVCTATLSVLGVPVAPGSLPLYVVTFSTILSAVLVPAVGVLADRSPSPRRLLGGFAAVGALAAASMVFITGTDWLLGALLETVAALCLGASLAVYNSLLVTVATPDERDRVSSRGWALGYAGGGLLLAINLVTLNSAESLGLSQSGAVRVSLLTAGLWWGLFTLIPVLGLRGLDREPPTGPVRATPVGAAIRESITGVVTTVRHARAYPQTLLFLGAFVLFNDGVQTVIATASIYGQDELGFEPGQLVVAILLVQIVAIGGALLFGRLAIAIGSWRAILVSLAIWLVVVVAALFLPAGRFGLFLALAASIGIVLGGTQAISRSLYSQLVPRGAEAAYFGLYQAADRGTSWLGTLVFGLVFQATGSYRPALASLMVFFVLGGVLLATVKVRAGIETAGNDQPATV